IIALGDDEIETSETADNARLAKTDPIPHLSSLYFTGKLSFSWRSFHGGGGTT
ncbi:hypothetical protein BgiBS90_020270, partial [Biomphalaria glabrata]